ncbi:MAG: heme A synthase [Methylococcaceae bacterium]|nr:MAG: heme A synthase [Methylococcaceae bacterium]
MINESPALARFRRIGTLTIFAVYFLILVGATVRASGAGMGCPDWPLCFGQWIPPTQESQLPANYHEIYAVGYANTTFNALKTWTEYVNRLVGVTIGLLILSTLWISRQFLKTDKTIFHLCLGVFFAVGFQGWLGKAVVASNLKPWLITAHMVLAQAIVAALLYAIVRSQKTRIAQVETAGLPDVFGRWLLIAMGLTLVQMSLGIQVREAVDTIMAVHQYGERELWRSEFPLIFYVHRSGSAVVLLCNGWLVWRMWRALSAGNWLRRCGGILMGLIAGAILAGVSMDRLGMPALAQPLHLELASLIFGMQFFIYIAYRYSRERRVYSSRR